MKTSLIKWACIAVAVALLFGALAYMRHENKALAGQVAALQASYAISMATIATQEALAIKSSKILLNWESDTAANKDKNQKVTVYVQKELQNNENFSAWAGQPLPDSAKRLFAD